MWKKDVEINEGCRRLLLEVKRKQCYQNGTEDDMAVDTKIDFEEDTIKGYENYREEVYTSCKSILGKGRRRPAV